MMVSAFSAVVSAAVLGLMAEVGVAGEYQRLIADLDGDRKPETVVVSAAGSGDFRNFTVQIGAATYAGKFFAVEGDVPELRIIAIDRRSPLRQLLVTTFEAGWCNYHVLAYSRGKLIPLLQFKSDAGCVAPQPQGNGTLVVSTWEGFWRREKTYRLDSTGTRLTGVPQQIYDVGVSGVAVKDFVLDPENCEKKKLTAGDFVRVERFESTKHLYLLKAFGGACGWIKEDKLNDYLGELPWAG